MTKKRLLTQTLTKRTTAEALASAKTRREWSNGDLGEALGIAEGTIRNRLDGDDAGAQLTAHELMRSIDADGTHIANALLALVGHRAVPIDCTSVPDALAIAADQARCASELIMAAGDGIDRDEAKTLLPMLVDLQAHLSRLEVTFRRMISGDPPP